jgi:hypothetical protein
MRAKRKVKDVGKEEPRAFLDVGGSSLGDGTPGADLWKGAERRVALEAGWGWGLVSILLRKAWWWFLLL